ncbi:hypothetical protein YPPY32_1395, partial [Yersinia pestis PY-32]
MGAWPYLTARNTLL